MNSCRHCLRAELQVSMGLSVHDSRHSARKGAANPALDGR